MPERLFLQLAFRGTAYAGWQVQRGKPTIMGEVDRALTTLLPAKPGIQGCCRTEAGAHAPLFFLHFNDPGDVKDDLPFRLNALLPRDIRAIALYRGLPPGAHARISTLSLTYRYFVHTVPNPFLDPFSFFLTRSLSERKAMQEVAGALGRISCLHPLAPQVLPKRGTGQIQRSALVFAEDGLGFFFELEAHRFLNGMALKAAGLLLQVGTGQLAAEVVLAALKNEERLPRIVSAPAQGLHLWQVNYPFWPTPPPAMPVHRLFGGSIQ
ncbi:MAG TPA: hypothetical protein P5550_10200 [Bacteroidales bacterium]|nr:hypothetical protein [Bacteroidales bacterium]